MERQGILSDNCFCLLEVLPDLVEGSSTGHMCAKLSQCVDDENIKESASACNFQRSEHKFDIVSLPSGDVKLCCVHALDKATSHVQDMDAVLKLVEEEFLRSHKIVGPPFSLKSLLEDICKRFCELANDCTNQSLVRKTSPEDFSQHILCCSKESAGVPVARKSLEVQNEKDPETETSQAFGNRVKRHPQLYVDDITKGEENVKISLVDERNNRQPPKFFYIPKNLIYQKAIVNISLARISDEDCCPSCSGDCLSSPVPCACARVTNGEFAYTNDGLLKSEFLKACINENKYVYCHDCPVERAKNERKPENCKGHSVKKFIKECWSKCGCSTQCGNRVVQRGISRNLQVIDFYLCVVIDLYACNIIHELNNMTTTIKALIPKEGLYEPGVYPSPKFLLHSLLKLARKIVVLELLVQRNMHVRAHTQTRKCRLMHVSRFLHHEPIK